MTPPSCMPDGSGGPCATSPLSPAVAANVKESRHVDGTPRGGSTICVTLPASAGSSKNIMAGSTRPWLQPGCLAFYPAGLWSLEHLCTQTPASACTLPRCNSYHTRQLPFEGRARSCRVVFDPFGSPQWDSLIYNNIMARCTQHDDTRTWRAPGAPMRHFQLAPPPNKRDHVRHVGCDRSHLKVCGYAVALKQYGCSYSRLNLQSPALYPGAGCPSPPYTCSKPTKRT